MTKTSKVIEITPVNQNRKNQKILLIILGNDCMFS